MIKKNQASGTGISGTYFLHICEILRLKKGAFQFRIDFLDTCAKNKVPNPVRDLMLARRAFLADKPDRPDKRPIGI